MMSKTFRSSHVTDEHLPIHPELLGAELASVYRRMPALLIDLIFALLVVIPWSLLWGALALHLQAPLVIPYAVDGFDESVTEAERDQARDKVWAEILQMIARRRPDLLPPEAHQALRAGDTSTADEILSRDASFNFDLGRGKPSTFDRNTNTYHLTGEILFGPFVSIFGSISGGLLYFTFFAWRFRGRTPGKWVAGIRVVRLDGKPISLWDAFGRAGGYSASLSTFGLGFLEAYWNPNRQTIHDRISGTVVIRAPRWRSKPSPDSAGSEIDEAPDPAVSVDDGSAAEQDEATEARGDAETARSDAADSAVDDD